METITAPALEMKPLRSKSDTFKKAHEKAAKAVRLAATKGASLKYKDAFAIELKAACAFNAQQKASQAERRSKAAAFAARIIAETEKAYKVAVKIVAGLASADGAIWVPKSVMESTTGLPAEWWMDKNWNFMNIKL